MQVVKFILTVIVMFVLQQPVHILFSALSSGPELYTHPEIILSVWAADEQSTVTGTPAAQQGEPIAPINPEGQEGQKTQEPLPAGQQQPVMVTPPKQEEQKTDKGFFERFQGNISRRLLTTAEWLDSFFADERVLKEENRSYILLRYDAFIEANSGPAYEPTFDVRLVLPQLENRTHLVFSSEPAASPPGAPPLENTTGSRVSPSATPAGSTEARNFTSAFHYFLKSTAEENFVVRTGGAFHLGSTALFIAPRYRLLIPFKPWDFRFSQEVVYRTDSGWQEQTQVDFERPLPHELFFRANVTGTWSYAGEDVTGYLYSLNFSLSQPLGPTHALNYEWSNSFQTKPVSELTEIVFRIRYRHSFWREWLFYELAPQCRFPRDRDFQTTFGALFRLDMFFGRIP